MTQPQSAEGKTRVINPRLLWLLCAFAAGVILIDQITKSVVVATMTEGESIPVIPNVFNVIFVRNPGAAFSMAAGQTWIFSILAAVVTGVIVYFARQIHSRAWAVVFGLILGGTLGNLADRLFRQPGFGVGEVIDFLNLPWLMPAIFNVADIAITAAAISFILLLLLGIGLDGKRQRREPQVPHGDA